MCLLKYKYIHTHINFYKMHSFFFLANQGLNLGPWQQKCGVLTTGPPRNSQYKMKF